MLAAHSEIKFSGEAESGEQLLGKLREKTYDVVLLDISLPGRSGLDVVKQLRSDFPDLPVLVLSMFQEEKFAIRMFKAGASGYLHKDSSPDQLLNAIKVVYRGDLYFSPKVSRLMVNQLNKDTDELHDILSDREFEVLILLGKGLSITRIAEMLSLSSKTVSTYKTRIMEKLNFKSSNDLVQYTIMNGLH